MNQAIINTLSIETWDAVELQNLHQRVFHLKRPDRMLPRQQLIEAVLNAGVDPKVLEAAFATGNTKTGPDVWSFNLPPLLTCPGRSEECTRMLSDGCKQMKPRCWACRNAYNMPAARVRHKLNLVASRQPEFVDWAVKTIQSNAMRVVRFPSTGDLYDEPYINKWAEIAWRLRDDDVIVFGFTRSWWAGHWKRDFYLRPALVRLAQMPKVIFVVVAGSVDGLGWHSKRRGATLLHVNR
jgi:hypothetical protein